MNCSPVFKTIIFLQVMCSAFAQKAIPINIQKEVKGKNTYVINRDIEFINEPSHRGIRLDARYGDGIVWLKNMAFRNGSIEFDVRGKDIKQHSFVGIAFHGEDTLTYEAIYLRPFNFKAETEPFKSRAIQYIARPDYRWQVLREEFSGKYEKPINPPPDPNAWIKVRVVVQGNTISAYINDNKDPSLVVESLGALKSGSIGFFVADTSGGDFANLVITKTD
ncbi:MAG: hypothetical protein ABI761_12410 [Saprospiraceae bacterium]